MEGHDAALKTYQHLTADYAALQQEASKYYQDYLARTVTLDLPDAQIQQATIGRALANSRDLLPIHFFALALSPATALPEPASAPDSAGFSAAILFGPRSRLTPPVTFPLRAPRSRSSANSSSKTVKSPTNFPKAQISWTGSRAILIPTPPPTPRRSTSLR